MQRVRKARTAAPHDPAEHNWMLHSAFVRRDFLLCEKMLAEVKLAAANGESPEYALFVTGLMCRERGAIQESLGYFQAAMRQNPANLNNAKQAARSLTLLGRHQEALELYDTILEAGVRDWHTLHNRGVCFAFIGNLSAAEDDLAEALDLQHHTVTFLQLGSVFVRQNEVVKAVALYQAAIKFSPEHLELLTALGVLHLQMGDSRKAFDALGAALTYNPREYSAIVGVGAILQQASDFDVALTKYRVLAVTAPESPELWNNIGMCFLGKAKLVAAIACVKHANYLAPLQWKTCFNLGLLHVHTRQFASAFHHLSAAAKLQPSSATAYMLLGVALMHLQDPANARVALDKAAVLDPNDPLVFLNYAALLCNVGDFAGGRAQLTLYERCQGRHPAKVAADVVALASQITAALHVGKVV